ncbi:MAG: WecB/TagA/CpsF family glycosyltransferase [Dehalococcoidia bacterium]|nr:WecB/TagA/CpsF family glycosyltransferase [Dehalococcoidia bacterium]
MLSAAHAHSPVGPIPVFNGGAADAVRFCLDAVKSGDGAWVATANLDYVALARRDPELRALLREATLVVADGAPVAWLARISGASRARRVAGVDLVCHIFASAAHPLRVVLYGSTSPIAHAAARHLEQTYPAVRVVGVVCPPFTELSGPEREAECALLQDLAPDVVLVALGCPKQEQLIVRYRAACPAAVWIGVGGTFDFFAGHRRRAPGLVQRLGGEWLIRLAQEPRRLWRRYLLHDIPALIAVAPSCMGTRIRGRPTSPATE